MKPLSIFVMRTVHQEEGSRSAKVVEGQEDLEEGESAWEEVRKTRYINYVTVTCTHLIIFWILGNRGYVIVRDTLDDG